MGGNKGGKASRKKNKLRRRGLKISRNEIRKKEYAGLAAAGNNKKRTKRIISKNKRQRMARSKREPNRNRGGRGHTLTWKQFDRLGRREHNRLIRANRARQAQAEAVQEVV